jgi:hypothetical protein
VQKSFSMDFAAGRAPVDGADAARPADAHSPTSQSFESLGAAIRHNAVGASHAPAPTPATADGPSAVGTVSACASLATDNDRTTADPAGGPGPSACDPVGASTATCHAMQAPKLKLVSVRRQLGRGMVLAAVRT